MPVYVDTAPFQIDASTPLPRVDMLFRMLRLSHCNVVERGVLVGSLTRTDLVAIGSAAAARRPRVLEEEY